MAMKRRTWRYLVVILLTALALILSLYSSVDEEGSSDLEESPEGFLTNEECQKMNQQRLERLERVCKTSKAAIKWREDTEEAFPKPQQFRANAKRRVAVCAAHKCGSESWR